MVFGDDGDDESVINSAAIPHLKMHKRWVALSYHRVRWAVAAGIIKIHHVPSKENAADMLSKHWDLPSVWEMIKPLLFWHENDDQKSHEESKKVNKDEGVDQMASGGGIKYKYKTLPSSVTLVERPVRAFAPRKGHPPMDTPQSGAGTWQLVPPGKLGSTSSPAAPSSHQGLLLNNHYYLSIAICRCF